MENRRSSIGIITQVAFFFAVAIAAAGIITYLSQYALSERAVKRQMEAVAANTAEEFVSSVKEYPSYEWLLRYWYAHGDEMDIEYDAPFGPGTETEAKVRLFHERHPEIQIRYATTPEIAALPPEDRRLYAEIVYSWVTTRIDEIKKVYDVDFLFCVLSDAPFDRQFFLLSSADEGAGLGTNYLEFYPLGVTVEVSPSQRDAMRNATADREHLADAGDYMDYYVHVLTFDRHAVFVGLTYNLTDMWANIRRTTLIASAQAMGYMLLLSVLFLGTLYFLLLRPLTDVQKSIRLYTQTKDSELVSGKLAGDLSGPRAFAARANEIGELSDDFVGLMEEIDDHVANIEKMTEEASRIGAELDLAARIQSAALPSTFPAFPDRSEFDLHASMDPAREVGGDLYDFFLIDDDHLCLEIADVSGKGIPAALFMMTAKAILNNTVGLGRSPAEILRRTNDIICANNPENMFVTVWIGILEISTGRLVAANAGHEYPMLKHPDEQFELFRDKHGLALGCMEGVPYREYELKLEPGSKLFVFTDGVPEATDCDDVLFGFDRMLRALTSAQDDSPREILAAVRRDVDDFVGNIEQFDDLTMLCIEYKGTCSG
ncbi:MAG: PP2C family protein-serine/threonine phosphatase [Coriobacteriaceae bacterium]|nr:PP2C family protein-serine/threonine phosphatase [Coriobacteriaceae bacterium]